MSEFASQTLTHTRTCTRARLPHAYHRSECMHLKSWLIYRTACDALMCVCNTSSSTTHQPTKKNTRDLAWFRRSAGGDSFVSAAQHTMRSNGRRTWVRVKNALTARIAYTGIIESTRRTHTHTNKVNRLVQDQCRCLDLCACSRFDFVGILSTLAR